MALDTTEHLRSLLDSLHLSSELTGGAIRFVGSDPVVPSVHHLGEMSALVLGANAAAVASLWRERSGIGQNIEVDLRTSIFTMGHTDFGINFFRPTVNGFDYVRDRDSPSPIRTKSDFHELKDGRWCSLSGHYRRMLFSWFELLNCSPNAESVTAAVKRWNSVDLEEAAAERGLSFALCMTETEWLSRAQGTVQSAKPLIEVRRIGDADRQQFAPGARPLSGVRVLGCTHTISGAVVGRTLAEQGADVLYLHSPNQIEYDEVYNSANVGTRSALVNLKTKEGNSIARDLLASADIFVENQRNGVMDRLGLSDDELMAIRPGIIIVHIRCFGLDGPWADRPGNDREGTAAAGVAISEGSPDNPRMPPCRTTNDYMTGYEAAAGATAALRLRALEGGSYLVSTSLVRSAMYLESLGLLDEEVAKAPGWENKMEFPPIVTADTPIGTLRRVAPPVAMSETPGRWSDPLLVPRGSSRPEWLLTG